MQSIKLETPEIDKAGLPPEYMNPGELEALVALVASVSPKVVLEIGVNEGRTAAAILRNVPGIEKYIGLDVTPGYNFAKHVQRNEVPKRPGFYARDFPQFDCRVTPRGSLDYAPHALPKCDAIFIDGDHGASAVLHDSSLAFQSLAEGGVIIWHDYHELGTVDVKSVLDSLDAEGIELTHVADTWLVFHRGE